MNPWTWSTKLGYHQGEVLTTIDRYLVCAGQTAVDGDGAPRHPGDMRRQMELAFDNVEAVLKAAGMDVSNLIKLAVYTTDVDETLKNFDVLGRRTGAAGVAPPMTLLGVTRLAMPQLMIEIEATAAD